MTPRIFPIILAGGSGTRLWPLSRKHYPKQFVKLPEFSGLSLFQKTLQRALLVSPSFKNLRILVGEDCKFHCFAQAEEIGIEIGEENLVIQPEPKNTLAAILLSVRSIDDGATALVLPSDHVMENEKEFAHRVEAALKTAQSSIVTFGLQASEPNTGYGYIKPSQAGDALSPVAAFKEKPSREVALEYLKSGYLWNAGIFLFSKKCFFSELRTHNPDYLAAFEASDDVSKVFKGLSDLSIDYGLLEKTKNIWVMPLPIYWNDLGSFDALEAYAQKSGKTSDVVEIDSQRNFAFTDSPRKPIVLIGTEDLLVVDTKDALLVTKKGESQKVKDALAILQKDFPGVTDAHLTVYRPWGSYTVIDQDAGFKTKRISVLPQKRLSNQMHYHRSEHWVVVS